MTVIEKECSTCELVKPADEYHKDKWRSSGLTSQCKGCRKAKRNTPESKKIHEIILARHLQTPKAKKTRKITQAVYYAANLIKRRAKSIVAEAVMAGILVRQSCEICDETKVHAHHDNYAEPLEVRWLCPIHHMAWHKEHGPGLNG